MRGVHAICYTRQTEEYVGPVHVTVTVGPLASGGPTYEALFLRSGA